MNKNLIMKHQEESAQLQEQITMLRSEIDTKTVKLKRYTEVVKTFESQIHIFEDFQKSSLEEMEKLKSQVRLFQELFQKEKTVNCELIRKLQPFMNNNYSSSSFQQNSNMPLQPSLESYNGNNNCWESRAYALDSQKSSFPVMDSVVVQNASASNYACSSLNEQRRKSAEPAKLTQTMSKNLSFGQPLFNSNQSWNQVKTI